MRESAILLDTPFIGDTIPGTALGGQARYELDVSVNQRTGAITLGIVNSRGTLHSVFRTDDAGRRRLLVCLQEAADATRSNGEIAQDV